MRIKLLLMFKNEGELLRSWIKYHVPLVGKDNLVVFDNGSTCAATRDVVDWAESNSIPVDRSRAGANDFVTRGDLFKDIINEKTYGFRADYYIPLDCDEFLAVEKAGHLEIHRSAIKSEFAKYKGTTRALAIHAGLDNDPLRPGQFVWSPNQMKKMFTAGNCFWLDEGFHYGLGMRGDEPIPTRIVYIHYHYKPYELLRRHAKEKLKPYTSDFSKTSLEDYIVQQRPAFHCAWHLLRSEAQYRDQFAAAASVPFPEIEAAFRRVGERLPFDTRPAADVPVPGLWRSLKARFTG